jgi:hypothetical protein
MDDLTLRRRPAGSATSWALARRPILHVRFARRRRVLRLTQGARTCYNPAASCRLQQGRFGPGLFLSEAAPPGLRGGAEPPASCRLPQGSPDETRDAYGFPERTSVLEGTKPGTRNPGRNPGRVRFFPSGHPCSSVRTSMSLQRAKSGSSGRLMEVRTRRRDANASTRPGRHEGPCSTRIQLARTLVKTGTLPQGSSNVHALERNPYASRVFFRNPSSKIRLPSFSMISAQSALAQFPVGNDGRRNRKDGLAFGQTTQFASAPASPSRNVRDT